MSILPSLVPKQIADNCIDSLPVNCGNTGVVSNFGEPSLKIEFPRNIDTLPLAGGAVVSMGIQNLKLYSSLNVANVLTKNLTVLQGLNLKNSIDDLVKSRVAVNNALFEIARKNLKVVDEKQGKRRAPSIYFSIYKGDDASVIKDGVFNPDLIRVCEFRYIPVETFSKILNNLTDSPNGFESVIGISGRSYDELKSLANDLSEKVNQSANSINLPNISLPTFPSIGGDSADIVDLLLEFFPVVNINEDALLSPNNNPIIGGYYTILEGKIYLKLPDLSGRNSSGESNGLISSEDSLWLEILADASITRTQIDKFKMPPLASFVGDQQHEFPKLDNLELVFELASDEVVKLYLSPVVKNIGVSKRRAVNSFSNTIELFSVPLLNKPIQKSGGRKSTINEDSSPSINDIKSYVSKVDLYYPGYATDLIYQADPSYPYVGQKDAHIYFGESNRPEMILSNQGRSNSDNNSRYFSLSSYGILEVLSSVRPKYYEDVPVEWISATPIKNSDGNYVAKFGSSLFNKLDLVKLDGSIEYIAYVADSFGQVTRVSGTNIKLIDTIPAITRIVPTGFTESQPLIIADSTIIELTGEDFGNAQQVNLTGQLTGTKFSFVPGDGVMSKPTYTSIILNFSDRRMSSFGLTGGQSYSITVQGSGSTLISQEDLIYLVSDKNDDRPVKGTLITKFSSQEISSGSFGEDPVVGIPLFKNGMSANLSIKSRAKIFTGTREVFAYLAIPKSNSNASQIVSNFAYPDQVATITTSVGQVIVPFEIEYEFSKSILADFSKSPVSGKQATLKFPGLKYSKYNFASLQGIELAYILFTGRPIRELVGNTTLSLSPEDHGILALGGVNGPAFIEPATILGAAADLGGENIISSFAGNPFNLDVDVFGKIDFSPDVINVYGKINRLALIVSGIKESFLRKRYTIKLGGLDISNKISREPIELKPGKLLFVLDNISPTIDGVLPLTINKKEKHFGSNYETSEYAGQFTGIINDQPGGQYSIDSKTGLLTVNTLVTGPLLISDLTTFIDKAGQVGIIGSSANPTNLLESVFPNSEIDGLIFDPRNTSSETLYQTFTQSSLTTNVSASFHLNSQDLSQTSSLIPGVKEDVSELVRDYLAINNGAVFPAGSYLLNKSGTSVMLFGGASLTGLISVKYNVPEVISIGEEEQDPILLSSNKEIKMTVGKKYKVRVKNTDRDFIIKLDEIVLKPRGRPESTGNPGEYIATVEAPEALLIKDNCFEICASTDNATRNRAKFSLGRDFVVDLDVIYQEMLTGVLKDKIPDVQGLVDKLKDAPLRFVSFLLDKANVPKDLIKSFCDFSFHLLAELKISLNGFQVLMVPIQVIFCIIDVICSLLNPVKIAKAVIRLFQCLYDLILLLPQISIPVMFLQLILHLLELLQCVIDKVLFTITAINEIAKAINLAAQKPINFTAIKALEETLSEYLFEIEADLSFLEPVLSILAIFLQLLQLIFRFPCSIDPGGGNSDCGVDGTLLAGIVAGIAAPDLTIIPEVMLPLVQSYSDDLTEGSTESAHLIEPSIGSVIAVDSSQTFLESMLIDSDSLRGTNSGSDGITFNATMAPTFTKSTKKAGKPTQVEFQFKSKSTSTALNSKNIDPNQTLDVPLQLLENTNGTLKVSSFGNIYSPVDGEAFLNIKEAEKVASVKPLILNLEVPVFSTDPVSGLPVQTGSDIVTRTFDNIPKMVLMDDEFNVYFIVQDGIEYNDDGFVTIITAEIVNASSAPKLKFSREDLELDTDNDPTTDDGTIQIFDFPQLYFFDMRQAGEQLEQFCSTASINSFPFEDNNTDDIENIVNESQDCLQSYLDVVRGMVTDMRTAQSSGLIPLPLMDVTIFENANTNVLDCLQGSIDQICKFVINGLNTSFKVVEDTIETPLEEFTNGDISSEILDGFQSIGPAFTGAREYAAGIGDSAIVEVGRNANIEIIPRDSYDEEIIGDLTEKIVVEIISDTTGGAKLILDHGNLVTKSGTSYFAKLSATQPGQVKLRARICERTIQALTFQGIDVNDVTTPEADCIPDNLTQITTSSPPLGALTKVDRILTVFFVKVSHAVISSNQGGDTDIAITDPQAFGSALEN